MGKQAISHQGAHPSPASRPAPLAWWWQSGEPVLLTLLALVMFTLPLLVLLELLALRQALGGGLALAWLSSGLLLTRLLRLLRQEWRRVGLLAVMAATPLLFVLALRSGYAMLVSPVSAADSQRSARPFSGAPLRTELSASAAQPVPATLRPQAEPKPLTFVAPPRISRQVFARILERGTSGPSPAAPLADELYAIIVGYGLDPAVALAFFAKESEFGVTGAIGREDTKNWGATRAAYNSRRMLDKIMVGDKPFVRYRSWQDGLRDWCELILNRYVAKGLDTVEKAVPIYAPASDNNDPTAYIESIQRRVAIWQGRSLPPPPNQSRGVYGDDLELALMTETFEAAGMEYHATWAFHRYALEEGRAGRPLGSPLNESRFITVGQQQYAVQTFTLDTLYTPIAATQKQTNWSDVRRMSNLMRRHRP